MFENKFFSEILRLPRDKRTLENFSNAFDELLCNDVNPNEATSPFGDKIVHICAFFNQPAWLDYMITTCSEKGIALDLTVKDHKIGHTALHLAASLGSVEIVNRLINSGQYDDLNLQDEAGMSPAHLAAGSFRPDQGKEILNILEEHGADLTLQDNTGQTPNTIPKGGLFKFSDGTHQNFMGQTPLHYVGMPPYQWDYLEKNYSISDLAKTKDVTGRIPFVYHIYNNNIEALRHLEGNLDALVNCADNCGKSLLYFAAFYGSPELNELLLAHGADPEQAAQNGLTPLDVAARYNRPEIVELYHHAMIKRPTTALCFSASSAEENEEVYYSLEENEEDGYFSALGEELDDTYFADSDEQSIGSDSEAFPSQHIAKP